MEGPDRSYRGRNRRLRAAWFERSHKSKTRTDTPRTLGGRLWLLGMFVEAEIQGRLARGVVSLPRAALRTGDRVLVVDEESRLRFREVEILRELSQTESLCARDCEEGERVCVSIVETAVEGMKVRTVEQESRPDVG